MATMGARTGGSGFGGGGGVVPRATGATVGTSGRGTAAAGAAVGATEEVGPSTIHMPSGSFRAGVRMRRNRGSPSLITTSSGVRDETHPRSVRSGTPDMTEAWFTLSHLAARRVELAGGVAVGAPGCGLGSG